MIKIAFIYIFLFTSSLNLFSHQYPILLNSSGTNKSLGRNIFGDYERGITFKIAYALQKALIEKGIFKVALAHKPGDDFIENSLISFVNRFSPDFYLSLHVYAEESTKPKITFYHLVYNPLVDLYTTVNDELSFIPLHKTHLKNIPISSKIARTLASFFMTSPYDRYFECEGSMGIPFKPLRGIICPAVAIEIGLSSESDFKNLIEPLAIAIYDYFLNCY